DEGRDGGGGDGAQEFGELVGAGVVGGDGDEELLPAVAAEQVVVAQHAAQPVGDLFDDVVAGLVAAGVVDDLEMVNVDHDDGQVAASGVGAGEALLGGFEDAAAVGDAGQRVQGGQLPHLVEQHGLVVGDHGLVGQGDDDVGVGVRSGGGDDQGPDGGVRGRHGQSDPGTGVGEKLR